MVVVKCPVCGVAIETVINQDDKGLYYVNTTCNECGLHLATKDKTEKAVMANLKRSALQIKMLSKYKVLKPDSKKDKQS